jgi:hypothetical protein
MLKPSESKVRIVVSFRFLSERYASDNSTMTLCLVEVRERQRAVKERHHPPVMAHKNQG